MAAALAPLLNAARKIIFVDPYFDPAEERYTGTFTAFLNAVYSKPARTRPAVIELYTNLSERRSNSSGQKSAYDRGVFQSRCKQFLEQRLPSGERIKIIYLKEKRQNGERLHNRYILTNLGGVSFPGGLDQQNKGRSETDECILLRRNILEKRLLQYDSNTLAFDKDGTPFEVTGIRSPVIY